MVEVKLKWRTHAHARWLETFYGKTLMRAYLQLKHTESLAAFSSIRFIHSASGCYPLACRDWSPRSSIPSWSRVHTRLRPAVLDHQQGSQGQVRPGSSARPPPRCTSFQRLVETSLTKCTHTHTRTRPARNHMSQAAVAATHSTIVSIHRCWSIQDNSLHD